MNGVILTHGKDSMEIPKAFRGRRLIIVKVQRDFHEGTYTCEAENSQGSAQPRTTSLVVEGMCNMNLVAIQVRNKWSAVCNPQRKVVIFLVRCDSRLWRRVWPRETRCLCQEVWFASREMKDSSCESLKTVSTKAWLPWNINLLSSMLLIQQVASVTHQKLLVLKAWLSCNTFARISIC